MVAHNRVGSAYLFSGPPGCGKEALALEFAGLMNGGDRSPEILERFRSCAHENLKLVFPLRGARDSGSKNDDPLKHLTAAEMEWLEAAIRRKAEDPFYKIEFPGATRIILASVRELRRTLYLKSLTGGKKVVVILDAHLLSAGEATSANALLKILEEPPPDTVFILVTDHKFALLPTILSRCQQVEFPPLEDRVVASLLPEKVDAQPGYREFILQVAQGNARLALALSREAEEDWREIFRRWLTPWFQPTGSNWKRFIT
ncbi:MAG: AAA family ATPase, partial [Candidatus Neomarinimicrobiota bacterium]